MPARPPNPWLLALAILACAFLPTGTPAAAQAPTGLPSAPVPQRAAVSNGWEQAPRLFMAGSFHLDKAVSGNDGATEQSTSDAGPTAPLAAQTLTMFPHSATARYWISGQANSIFQAHGHFHSPYQGPNSLIDDSETKASEVATLYLGYQLWPNTRYNTDLIVDFENAGGRGISQALGLAGERCV